MTTAAPGSDARCPTCGVGDLVDIAFDAEAASARDKDTPAPEQGADTRQVETYTCGHRILGPALSEADADIMEVERRSSGDTVAEVEDPTDRAPS